MDVPFGKAFIYRPQENSKYSCEMSYRLKRSLGRNEVLIRTFAAGLNPLDYKIPRIVPFWMVFKGLPVGQDVCGEVVAVGENVTELRRGDIVFGHGPGLCEYSITLCNKLSKVPIGISHSYIFGGLCAVSCTALQMLRRARCFDGRPKLIMVIGAAGGVGSLAIQIAKCKCESGTTIIGICSSGSREFVLSLGADRVIAYDAEDFSFQSCSEPNYFDAIIDCVSSPEDYNYVSHGMRFLKHKDGQYVASNTASRYQWLMAGFERFIGLRAFRTQYSLIMVNPNSDDLLEISSLVESGKILLHVDEYLDFIPEEIERGLEKLNERHVRG
jgi:NADPH:quinone reductase-like Zn-dependent oxidoreductase